MIRKILLVTTLLFGCISYANAQTAPIDISKGITVKQLNDAFSSKIDTNRIGAANGVAGLDENKNLPLSYAIYGEPMAGDSLGIGYYSYIKPNPTIIGSITIEGISPILHLTSMLSSTNFDIWEDRTGSAKFSTNSPNGNFDFFDQNGIFNFHATGNNSSSQINLYGNGNSIPASIWQDTGGGLYLSPGSTNGSTSIYANGTGGIALYSNNVQFHGTDNSQQLEFFGTSTTDHSSIWQDASLNFNISTSPNGNNLNLYAEKDIVLNSSTILPLGTQTSSSSCNQGEIRVDDNFIYVCSSSKLWKKSSLENMQ